MKTKHWLMIGGGVVLLGGAAFFIVRKLKQNKVNQGIGEDSSPKEMTETEKLFNERIWVTENLKKEEYRYTTNKDGSINEKGTEMEKRNNDIIKKFEDRKWEFYVDETENKYYIVDKSGQPPYKRLIERKIK